MVLTFEDPFSPEGEELDGGGSGGSGTTTTPTVTTVSLLPVPTGQYRKTRHAPTLAFPNPVAGSGVNTEAQELIPGPNLDVSISDSFSGYRIVGFFPFDNAEYDFTVTAPNAFRVLLDGIAIIDEFVGGSTRTTSVRIPVIGGNRQVEINVGFGTTLTNVLQRLQFSFAKVPAQAWVSCEDGLERPGDPPIGWIQTTSGCFKPPLGDSPSDIDLREVVQINSTPRIERAYVVESGVALTAHRMSFFNRADNMSVIVQLGGPKPVKFVTITGLPSDSFELQPKQERVVDMEFIASELDVLPEGLITTDVLVSLSAGTITLAKDGDDSISIGVPIVEEIIELPGDDIIPPDEGDAPLPTWNDCSSGTVVVQDGFPPSDWVIRSDGCYVPPTPVEPTPTLSIGFTELSPSFEGTRRIARGRLVANLGSLGSTPLSAFTFAWNFDKQLQGAGTGDTTVQNTVASWRMTEADLRRLETSDSQTTRSVEVIASAGNKIVRTTLQVVLDDPGLVFISPPIEEEPTTIGPSPTITTAIGGGGGGGEAPLDEE